MSTIRVDNFGPSAGGTTYSARGIAKAWVNFNGTSTIAARDSENVSSLTDHEPGNYTINFTSAMANSNYSFAGGVNAITGGGTSQAAFFSEYSTAGPTLTRTTTGFRGWSLSVGLSNFDGFSENVNIFGDLA